MGTTGQKPIVSCVLEGSKVEQGRAGAAYGRLAKPLLLVSDLDDTLIGSTPAADASTAAFKAVWDRSRAAGVNCTLAINTGRYVFGSMHSSQQQ